MPTDIDDLYNNEEDDIEEFNSEAKPKSSNSSNGDVFEVENDSVEEKEETPIEVPEENNILNRGLRRQSQLGEDPMAKWDKYKM